MSEYQYYEFQAIDRPLTKSEMDELRSLTSRATITPTSLKNVYNWGSFRGRPATLMERYFDAFLYEANWGTRRFMLRLPRRLIDLDAAERYCVDDCLNLRVIGDFVLLELLSNDEAGTHWIDEGESEAWLPALLPLRLELAYGDLRILYLGWLVGVQNGLLEDEEIEPPPPPGLRSLSAPLQTLLEFLRVDVDLLAAAEQSQPLVAVGPSPGEIESWIVHLPESEKNALLLRAWNEGGQHLQSDLFQRFRQARRPSSEQLGDSEGSRRTVGKLRSAGEQRAIARGQAEAERQAQERARREREESIARAKYLDGLVGREPELWSRIDGLVELKRAREYDQAVQYLKDLRDLASRANGIDLFQARLDDLRTRQARKPSFLSRLTEAGL